MKIVDLGKFITNSVEDFIDFIYTQDKIPTFIRISVLVPAFIFSAFCFFCILIYQSYKDLQ